MTRFEVGDETFIRKVDEHRGYNTPLKSFEIEKGDRVEITCIISREGEDGLPQYGVNVVRDDEVIESDISVSELEILGECDSDENHSLVYHDKREEWICPFCI